jgi:hypothetical protein
VFHLQEIFLHASKLISLFSMVAALSACGGGGGDASPATGSAPSPSPSPSPSPAPAPAPAPTQAPGGLYVGYYQEDPANNPEDPMPGAYSLSLPSGNGNFAGSMFFTYVGCQTSNVGAVAGTKANLGLSGTWSGTIDNSSQSGAYSGSYDPASASYSGTYSNSRGKQFRDLSPCIQYSIAANGSWEMFPVNATVPSNFALSMAGRTINWSAVTGANFTLVYLLDPAIATSSGNPVLWQTVLTSASRSIAIPNTVALTSGRPYVAAVGVGDAGFRRAAFGSLQFTQP